MMVSSDGFGIYVRIVARQSPPETYQAYDEIRNEIGVVSCGNRPQRPRRELLLQVAGLVSDQCAPQLTKVLA